uniref:hypothetical protein n=1 Tax=Saccharococcus caldoxylosilyticus TaxID=81408 RepID=UPI003144F34A
MSVAPELLWSLQKWDIEFALGDATYDNKNVRKVTEQSKILFISPIHQRNSNERKNTYGRVIPVLLKIR